MGRIQHAAKNIAFGYIGNLSSTILGFLLRTVFIYKLDATLLGVNGLYSGVLTMLSLAELGIGTALNFSLYAPVARGDREKIKSYMAYYKKAYRMIAMIILVMGVILIPFLKYFIKNPGNYGEKELILYYLIFLFNTVSTYFVSYKYSIVNAEQKNYIQTNIITVTKLITTLLQILILLLTANFLFYLLAAAFVELAQKIYVNHYFNQRYPYLKDKQVQDLSIEERKDIISKTKALVYHKVGDVMRLQTDSIIISSFIQVAIVGIVDNYLMVINSISAFSNVVFNSVISSFGNLIATENEEKQYQVFQVYRFVAGWFYGLSAMGFLLLLSPLIYLWFGEEWLLAGSIVNLILVDYYFKGERIVLSNFKTAAGVFEQDKYLTLIQGIVNLIISIWLVLEIGLAGVYIGTIISGWIANVSKPIIIYKACFHRGAGDYFKKGTKQLLVMAVIYGLCQATAGFVLQKITMLSFLIMGVLIVVIFHLVFLPVYWKTKEMEYLRQIVTTKLKTKRGNLT